MEPNNNMQDEPITPALEDQPSQPVQPEVGMPKSEDTPTPVVSPLQAITTSEDSSFETSTPTVMEPLEETPVENPPLVAPVVDEPKKSKTTLYLLISLGVVVLAVAGLYIFSIL